VIEYVLKGVIFMQLFKRVTILALLALPVLLGTGLAGCGSGSGHLGKNGQDPDGVQWVGGAEARLEEAVLLYHQGNLTGADEILAEILAQDPAHPRALQYRQYLDRVIYATVYPGDTLSEIAGYYYEDVNMWPVIARANRISDPKAVKAYMRLRIPWFQNCGAG